jgi:tetratricopeptide (TPR) repeat protein
LIDLVKHCQERHRLTLDEIGDLFRREEHRPDAIRRALGAASPAPAALLNGARRLTFEELVSSVDAQMDRRWAEQLAARGLLDFEVVENRRLFSPAAVEELASAQEAARQGISVERFASWREMLDRHFDEQRRQIAEWLSALPSGPQAYPRAADMLGALARYAAQRARLALDRVLIWDPRRHRGLVGPDRKHVVPSETFIARSGLNREIDRLVRLVSRRPQDITALRSLARAYHLKSDWVRLQEVVKEILRLAPDDGPSIAMLGRVLSHLDRHEESVRVLEDGLKTNPHPLIKLRLAQSLVTRAQVQGSLRRFCEALEAKNRLAREAIEETRSRPQLQRKIRLILALDAMDRADPLRLERVSAAELEQLRVEFAAEKPGNSVLNRISLAVARMFATYALYLLRRRERHPDAEKLRRELLRLDPQALLPPPSADAPVVRGARAKNH